ncbi:MAG: hypothetical protein HYV18_07105 [Gammaproteobacteria bacterium]|nr:hypothetical protein [Gammaproteobacteria bacterium]
MKPSSGLLVLGPGAAAQDWSSRLRQRSPPIPAASLAGVDERLARACSGVLVVNDRSAEAAEHLGWARRLQACRPGLPVAVLTVIRPRPDGELLETALGLADPAPAGAPARLESAQALAILASHLRGLTVRETIAGVVFEYGG